MTDNEQKTSLACVSSFTRLTVQMYRTRFLYDEFVFHASLYQSIRFVSDFTFVHPCTLLKRFSIIFFMIFFFLDFLYYSSLHRGRFL